jgi:hypothetical protein
MGQTGGVAEAEDCKTQMMDDEWQMLDDCGDFGASRSGGFSRSSIFKSGKERLKPPLQEERRVARGLDRFRHSSSVLKIWQSSRATARDNQA